MKITIILDQGTNC